MAEKAKAKAEATNLDTVTVTGIRRGIAWKTGTSFGFRDAWSVGVSDRHTIGVWVGRPDGTPNPGFFGANVAAPLLIDLFNALDAGPPTPRTPPVTRTTRPARPRSTPTATCPRPSPTTPDQPPDPRPQHGRKIEGQHATHQARGPDDTWRVGRLHRPLRPQA